MKKINPKEALSHQDFCELFEQLPLLEEERALVKDTYWEIYSVCLAHPEVPPEEAWLATKNTFIAKENQIGERIKRQKLPYE